MRILELPLDCAAEEAPEEERPTLMGVGCELYFLPFTVMVQGGSTKSPSLFGSRTYIYETLLLRVIFPLIIEVWELCEVCGPHWRVKSLLPGQSKDEGLSPSTTNSSLNCSSTDTAAGTCTLILGWARSEAAESRNNVTMLASLFIRYQFFSFWRDASC